MRAVCQYRLTWECQHRYSLRVSTVPSDDVAPFRGAGLWLHVGTPQQGVAASTTETKTTPPLERVPSHARCGEGRRSARRLLVRTARPFRSGHSVDVTRGGDVHTNPGTEEDGFITVWQLNIAGLSSVKNIAFAARLEQRPPDIVLLQEINNRGGVATRLCGHNDYLRASLGAVVVLPFWCATLYRASACRSLALTSWRPLLSVYFRRAVPAFACRISTTLPQQLVNNPHLLISFAAWARRDYRG
ncbi:hypothetical protein TcCL_Unassigned00627 [Trypanosoma cruzi]|nr:hypothetical protein TcCL_Unassigned00627 [Trypanosoma cruzi]